MPATGRRSLSPIWTPGFWAERPGGRGPGRPRGRAKRSPRGRAQGVPAARRPALTPATSFVASCDRTSVPCGATHEWSTLTKVTGPTIREPVRVLVVDADRRVRQSLAGLIGVSDGLTLTASVGDPVAAITVLESTGADVVVMDPRLPEAEVGIALMGEIRARWPLVGVVALAAVGDAASQDDDPDQPIVVSAASPELLVETLRACGPTSSRSGADPWQDGATRAAG